MEKIYYIELVISSNDRREWNFESLELRNEVFNQAKEKFKEYTTDEIPFMDLDVGVWISGKTEKITVPLRLKKEMKNEVIQFMDSLEK